MMKSPSIQSGPASAEALRESPDDYEIRWIDNIPYWGVHAVAVAGVIWMGWSWYGLLICLVSYYVRMFGITGGYHRYFSHRSYKTSRLFQFFLALLGGTSTQKGALWWASHHRRHHKYSDQPEDVHSVRQRGFYWSHQGWILAKKFQKTDWDRVKDLSKFWELRALNKFPMLVDIAFAVALYFIGGLHMLLWGYFVSTMLLWHGTFTINSLSHLIGRQRYKTGDDSRNNWVLAIITMGEGWHNNHHYYQRAACQGFYWWEIDMTYYVLKLLSYVGIVWDVHRPPLHVREDASKRLDGRGRAQPAKRAHGHDASEVGQIASLETPRRTKKAS